MGALFSLKVALVVPSTDVKVNRLVAPLGLGCLAAYLKKELPEVEVRVFDGALVHDIAPAVVSYEPDLVGVTFVTPTAPSAYKLFERLRHDLRDTFLVAGGVHASQCVNEALTYCDCVVKGEGEVALVDIVKRRIAQQPIDRVIEGQPIGDLDTVPMPYPYLDMQPYLIAPSSVPNLGYPTIGIVTSRGCPFICRFCWNNTRTAKVRWHSAKRVVEEIEHLHSKYGIRYIFFSDDEFLINRSRLEEIIILFKERGITAWLRWGCQARARTIDENLLRLIEGAGCVAVSLGIESAVPHILEYLKHNSAKVEDNEKALRLAAKVGLDMGGSLILGTPGETEQDMLTTARWCWLNDDLKYFGFTLLTPYPGTAVFNDCQAQGLISADVDYTSLVPPISPADKLFLVSTVDHEVFMQLYWRIHVMTWLVLAVRKSKHRFGRFVRLAVTPSWWKCLYYYPDIMRHLLHYSLKGAKPAIAKETK
jgi:radical SAM superfamily enzyme YgiQ (UPF0313 family)